MGCRESDLGNPVPNTGFLCPGHYPVPLPPVLSQVWEKLAGRPGICRLRSPALGELGLLTTRIEQILLSFS